MADIITTSTGDVTPVDEASGLIEVSEGLLMDARSILDEKEYLSVPIAQLSTLGSGVSSLIPALNTVTQTTTIATDGLFRVANKAAGDVLKMAKNGNAWGAMKTATGGSKMVQLAEAGPLTATSKAVSAINPATMMMSVALFSIEQELVKIEEMQKQIMSFLEIEKESEIEADVETLVDIIKKYKLNWDNEHYLASNHKMVADIQRTARKNMNAYQKLVAEALEKKKLVVAQKNVKQAVSDLEKKFKYYRLSLYIFSLASLLEIMLGGNFKEEYISGIKDEIQKLTINYRDLFEKSSLYLEKLNGSEIEANVLKGFGVAGEAVGKFIGGIPFVNKGPVDEILQEKGSRLKDNAEGMKNKAAYQFASISNPGTGAFMEKMEDLIRIYSHTDQICFDDKNVYLIAK